MANATEYIDRYTIWSCYGRSAVADDRPVVRLADGTYGFKTLGSFNTREIARFETEAEAAAVAATLAPHRNGATKPHVTLYPFYAWEIA